VTLRVRIEIVPFGEESRAREIARFDIFNKGGGPKMCYGVIEMDTERNTSTSAQRF
jgi:hypothetical protein